MMEFVREWAVLAAALSAGVVGLGVLWKRCVLPSYRWTRRLAATGEAILGLVEAELKTNSGASLVDRMGSLEQLERDHKELHLEEAIRLTTIESRLTSLCEQRE